MTRAVRWLVAPARRLSLRAPAASGGSWPLTERPMALAGCSEPQRPGARLLARALSAGAGGEAPPSDGAAEKKVRRRQEVGLSEWGDRLRGLLKFVGYYSKESTMIRNSSKLYLNARAVVVDTDFLGQFDLEDSWENEFYVNCLHLWMIFVRIRKEGPGMKQLSQEVFDNFWNDMQQGMFHSLGVQSLALNTRTRELQNVFYGTAVSYDFALGTSDALLAAALYRNLFGLEGRAVHVNKMTAYVRKQLQMLDQLESEVFLSGQWKFSKVD